MEFSILGGSVKINHFFKNILFSLLQSILLTNRVLGAYCQLRTEFFPARASRLGHKSTRKKLGSETYSTDLENEVSKIFIICLRLIGRAGKGNFQT